VGKKILSIIINALGSMREGEGEKVTEHQVQQLRAESVGLDVTAVKIAAKHAFKCLAHVAHVG